MRSPMLWSPSHTAIVTSPTTDTPISKGIRPPCAFERQLPHVLPADTKMPTGSAACHCHTCSARLLATL